MKIQSIQKVIKVGSSLAVTIPAKDAKAAGIVAGSEVKLEASLVSPQELSSATQSVIAEYEAFKKQYAETLKNLSQR